MNKIKGLLTKDILELKAYKKNFILSICIYIALIIMNSDNNEFIIIGTSMIMFLFCIYSLATFSYDEKSLSDRYILSLPVTKKDIVLSKYILVISSVLLGLITGILVNIIFYVTKIYKIPNLDECFSSLLGIIYVFSLIHGIQIPCIYKYGAEKGRMQIYLIMIVLFAIIGGLSILFPNINLNGIDSVLSFLPVIVILLTILNYYISYKISIKLFEKREM